MDINKKLEELNIVLPVPAKPIASYVPVRIIDNIAYISGQLPIVDGRLRKKGIHGKNVGLEIGAECAEICALNILAVLKEEIGDLNKIQSIVKLSGFVAATPDFIEHPKIINGASDLFVKIFGDNGIHARAAVGVSSLPLNAPVEIEAVIELKKEV